EIQRPACLIAAVVELARNAEAGGGKQRRSSLVPWRGFDVEKRQFMLSVLQPVPQHVDGSARRDLGFQTAEELAALRIVGDKLKLAGDLFLCLPQECRQLHKVNG